MSNSIDTSNELIASISPTITLRRNYFLAYAVSLVADALRNDTWDSIHFTTDVYLKTAHAFHTSRDSAQRCIFRAADDCWMDGKNDNLHHIIGRKLPVKPKPSEFLLYCAYYLCYGKPYHSAAAKGTAPLAF